MTLRDKILKTFVVSFHEITRQGGPEEFFKKFPVGGIYFNYQNGPFNENGGEMGIGTTYERFEYIKSFCPYRLLICADGVTIPGQITGASAASLGANINKENAYNYGKIIGMQMNSRGIDMALAPCIDLLLSNLMPIPAITDDPETDAIIHREVIRGIQDQGVCATAKHFPGLGTNNSNTHFSAGHNIYSFEDWMKTYGYTYKEMIKENVMSVMTTHVTLKSYDDEDIDGFPPIATFSKKLTTNLLKDELGFKGPVITDALIMGGMATGDHVKDTVQSFIAGSDLLLWPPMEAADVIEEKILSGEIPMSRLDDALERIDRMMAFREKALQEKSYDTPDTDFVNEQIAKINSEGICLLKNEIGLLPLKKENYKNILIIDATNESDNVSSELLQKELQARGFNTTVENKTYDDISLVTWPTEVEALEKDYDLVIFNCNMPIVCSMCKAGDPFMLIWSSHMFSKSKKLIINYGSPFFVREYLPDDPTVIEVNCRPTDFIVKNIVKGIMGEIEFKGKSIIKE